MIINNNIPALNTHRMLTTNNAASQKAMEKLSSGLRINRAGDDAAGLAISEKMRGQIRGLDMASKNAQDGISMIQTAEGALNETHSILQRMRELAVQASNDSNTPEDRDELQKEVDQLAQELSRIAETTEFNTQNLLDGTFAGTFHIGANEGQNISLSIENMSADALGVAGNPPGAQFDIQATGSIENSLAASGMAIEADETYNVVTFDEVTVSAANASDVDAQYGLADADGNIVAVSDDGGEFTLLSSATAIDELGDTNIIAEDDGGGGGGTPASVSIDFGFELSEGDSVEITDITDDNSVDAVATATAAYDGEVALEAGTYTVAAAADHEDVDSGFGLQNENGEIVAFSDAGEDWTTEAGGEGEDLFTTATLDTTGDEIVIAEAGGIDISSQEDADSAITTIQGALDEVSAERSKLGAYQNRLEHTINNLGTSAENLQAAESRIRDVDYAPAA